MKVAGRQRVIIEKVFPEINNGDYPIKRIPGEKIKISAHIFSDGHDAITANVFYRRAGGTKYRQAPLKLVINDEWEGELVFDKTGVYQYTVKAWINRFSSWKNTLKKKYNSGQDITGFLLSGAEYLRKLAGAKKTKKAARLRMLALSMEKTKPEKAVKTALGSELAGILVDFPDNEYASSYEHELQVIVEREKALFSSWYEFFPRSFGKAKGVHGNFKSAAGYLPVVAEMGFDIVYLPPIHPIGRIARKGRNNSLVAKKNDPGCPWSIGSSDGGHDAINPKLGTMADFKAFMKKAKELGIETAIDLAYQCSRDHPYIKEHPEWFFWNPDGTIHYAENPPKKYEDVVPFDFENENWESLWKELERVMVFWIEAGVRIFRVDNPHTKPFAFWEWLLERTRKKYPDVLFLSEAFTRPKTMYRLAKIGFTQSYTYFTWRYSKSDFINYINELTGTETREFFRPNFWPNTPDILPFHLQAGGRASFIARLILAATLSSNYGMYGPAFENCIVKAVKGKEEYLDSEKYEIKSWDALKSPGSIRELVKKVNNIRKNNKALQSTWNTQFCDIDNDQMLCYFKADDKMSNIVLICVNLDPVNTQSGWVRIPIEKFGIEPGRSYAAHDLLSGEKFSWKGDRNFIILDPGKTPAHIIGIRKDAG